MLSGNFQTLPISSIIVERASRQRRQLDNLEDLAESIRRVGQLNPIIIDREMRLVAGERRLTAMRDILGWDSVTVQWADELPPATLYLIELEENIKRDDLDWRDYCAAVANYHAMQASIAAEENREWSTEDTAKAINIDRRALSRRIAVHEAIQSGDPLVVAADKYSTALGIVERKEARAKDSALAGIEAMISGVSSESPSDLDIEIANEEILSIASADESSSIPYRNVEFQEFVRTYSGPKFNFIHCDFPYGVNANKHAQGAADSFGGYEDSPEIYWDLLDNLSVAMENVIAESAHMMFWFSMDFYSETQEELTKMGWRVNPFPLIWHKSDNSGILPDPKRGPRRIYETAFLCSRGDRLVVQSVSNVFSAPNLKEVHMSEKNRDMLRHFFRMFVDEHSRVLDPTMGSGNALIVANSMGAHSVLGLERDPEFYSAACGAWVKAQG